MKSSHVCHEDYISMWSVQTKVVVDVVNSEGVSYVKQQYITEKYKDTAWSFQEAYGFFIEKARTIIERPQGAESPIWMFCDKSWAVANEDTVCMELRIPRKEIILFDLRTWSKVLNLSFVGTDVEEKEFAQELKRQGISHSSDVFQTPYYPLLKSKIVKSWDRLFMEECTDPYYMQGATWELKKEWIKSIGVGGY